MNLSIARVNTIRTHPQLPLIKHLVFDNEACNCGTLDMIRSGLQAGYEKKMSDYIKIKGSNAIFISKKTAPWDPNQKMLDFPSVFKIFGSGNVNLNFINTTERIFTITQQPSRLFT